MPADGIIVHLNPSALPWDPSRVTVRGMLATTYRPVPLDRLTDGGVSFAHRMDGKRLATYLDAGLRASAVILGCNVFAELPAELVERFCRHNALIATEAPPRTLFSDLLSASTSLFHDLLDPPRLAGAPHGVRLGPEAFVADDAVIGEGTIIGAGAIVGSRAVLGRSCVVGERAMIFDGVRLGVSVRVGPCAIVGSRVNSYEAKQDGSGWHDRPQVGSLVVGDDVRIGAHAVINGGTLSDTMIGPRCRIGDRVIVGHNVRIDAGVAVTAGAVICGSTLIGEKAWIGPGAVIKNKIRVGAGAVVAAGSVIVEDVAPEARVYPVPALEGHELLNLKRLLRSHKMRKSAR